MSAINLQRPHYSLATHYSPISYATVLYHNTQKTLIKKIIDYLRRLQENDESAEDFLKRLKKSRKIEGYCHALSLTWLYGMFLTHQAEKIAKENDEECNDVMWLRKTLNRICEWDGKPNPEIYPLIKIFFLKLHSIQHTTSCCQLPPNKAHHYFHVADSSIIHFSSLDILKQSLAHFFQNSPCSIFLVNTINHVIAIYKLPSANNSPNFIFYDPNMGEIYCYGYEALAATIQNTAQMINHPYSISISAFEKTNHITLTASPLKISTLCLRNQILTLPQILAEIHIKYRLTQKLTLDPFLALEKIDFEILFRTFLSFSNGKRNNSFDFILQRFIDYCSILNIVDSIYFEKLVLIELSLIPPDQTICRIALLTWATSQNTSSLNKIALDSIKNQEILIHEQHTKNKTHSIKNLLDILLQATNEIKTNTEEKAISKLSNLIDGCRNIPEQPSSRCHLILVTNPHIIDIVFGFIDSHQSNIIQSFESLAQTVTQLLALFKILDHPSMQPLLRKKIKPIIFAAFDEASKNNTLSTWFSKLNSYCDAEVQSFIQKIIYMRYQPCTQRARRGALPIFNDATPGNECDIALSPIKRIPSSTLFYTSSTSTSSSSDQADQWTPHRTTL